MLCLWERLCYDNYMKVLGIIAEYNPLHNGHLYHIEQCRKESGADYIVVVMSGNFTQRGEAAILDKWTRSRLAVENGADLVLELPFAYAVNSAEYFARGGVGILQSLGCVTHIGFGAEAGTAAQLKEIAALLTEENNEFQQHMKLSMSEGVSYAKARETAVKQILGEEAAGLIKTPNNILAVEYLKQLKRTGSNIEPVVIGRKGAGYNDKSPEGGFASATALREHLSAEERRMFVPENVADMLDSEAMKNEYFHLIQSKVLGSTPEELARVFSVGEGIENRMLDQIRRSSSMEDFIENVKSKRYPQTRIQRILCQMLMGLTDFEDEFYARILAAGKKGTGLLKHIRKTSEVSVITNINKEENLPQLIKFDILASDMYNIIAGNDLYKKSDYVMHPFIQKG